MSRGFWSGVVAGAVCMVGGVGAQAQAQSALAPAAPAPQQVVVNGGQTEVEASRDFVAGKIVIGKARIADSGLQNAGELLAREPAVSVGKNGRIGLLGLAGYTQILVDGMPYLQGDPFAIDLLQIERIEIVKSATAATGPVGIAGTINIVRRKTERKAMTQWRAGATSTAGRLGEELSWSNNQVASGTPFSYNAQLAAKRVPTPAESHYVETTGAARAPGYEGDAFKPGELRTLLAGAELVWTLDASNKITVSPDGADIATPARSLEQRRLAGGATLDAREDDDQRMRGGSLPLRWDWQIDADSTLAVKWMVNGSRQDSDSMRTQTGAQTGAADGPLARRHDETRDAVNRFLTLDWTSAFAGGHAVSAGAKLSRSADDVTYADATNGQPDASLAVFGRSSATRQRKEQLFAQDEWRIDRTLALNLGMAVERRRYAFDEGAARNTAAFTMWSPSLHLSKKLGGDARRQLRLSLARSFQPPFADQMLLHPTINDFAPCPVNRLCGANTADTADSSGNPHVQPERARGLNLSYARGLGRASELVTELYTRAIRAKIGTELALEDVAWASAPRYVLRPANLGQARVRGVNLEARLAGKDVDKRLATLELHGSVGWAHSVLSDVPGPDNRIAEQTPWRLKFGGSYAAAALPVKFGLEASYLPGDWARDDASTRVYQSSRATLGLNARWKLDAKSNLSLNLDNLLAHTGTRIDDYLGGAGAAVLRRTTDSAHYQRIALRFDTVL